MCADIDSVVVVMITALVSTAANKLPWPKHELWVTQRYLLGPFLYILSVAFHNLKSQQIKIESTSSALGTELKCCGPDTGAYSTVFYFLLFSDEYKHTLL